MIKDNKENMWFSSDSEAPANTVGPQKEIDGNTFLNKLKKETNFVYTENGAVTHKSTLNKVLDMFAFGGAYRKRTDADVITLFKDAFEQDQTLAMKCLFYIRDVRGGQGERRFFRVAFKWLCDKWPEYAQRNLINVSEYGRWDDLIYVTVGTPLENYALQIIEEQLKLDLDSKTPSLLAKWLPSENASSYETNRLGNKVRKHLKMTHKQYRQALSKLRTRINIVEKLMSENRWDEIEFDKIPSKAGMIYKNAFARRDLIAQKYKEFVKDETKTVNAKTLYPYDIAHQAFHSNTLAFDNAERIAINKYWENLPNYYNGREENGLAIVDTSGSMGGQPIEAAVSLGAYIAEKAHGPFANHFLTFSAAPDLCEFHGVDIVDKFNRAYKENSDNWGGNTDLRAVFDLLLKTAKSKSTKAEDMPTRLYIFSDMEFDGCVTFDGYSEDRWGWRNNSIETTDEACTLLEEIAKEWHREGYELPDVIFWNLDARQNNIPMLSGGRFGYVSGLSPVLIEQILSGVTGVDLMLKKLLSERYEKIV